MYEEVLDFYNNGAEIGRLERGIGRIEFERTKEILERFLPEEKCVVYDIGGGVGVYSEWLAGKGHEVHLFELSPAAVDYAKDKNRLVDTPIHHMEVADAREIDRSDESADVVLVMGPLYHLFDVENRMKALQEARRLLKKDGLFVCTGITRYGNLLWGFSILEKDREVLEVDSFKEMIQNEIRTGQHVRPEEFSSFLARAYFHRPRELVNEVAQAGIKVDKILAVEGPGWTVPNLDGIWENTELKNTLLQSIRLVEDDMEIMSLSPHFIVIGKK